MTENLLFLRNRPRVFNLGDFLCTPLHYFDFSCKVYETTRFLRGKEFKTIIGGGAFNDLAVGQKVPHDKTVAWGIGSSIHGRNSIPTRADNLPFRLYGVRDPDAVSDQSLVLPCVSCMHPLVQLPVGDETNIFLNFDENITNLSVIENQDFLRDRKLKVYTNYLSEMQFMRAFARTRRVITNSYHASYWALLSGREVAIIGYSTKFRSLMRLVGLNPEDLAYYDVSNQMGLRGVVEEILRTDRFHKITDHEKVRQDFIETNIGFADKCLENGFISKYEVREHSKFTMMSRNFRYNVLLTAANTKARLASNHH